MFESRLVLAIASSALIAAPAFAQTAARARPIDARDRVYTADQFSNTVSVVDPSTNELLGLIKLGEPAPGNLSPLYRGQLLVHGLGFSPDRSTLAVVSIGSNSLSFIDTATNAVKRTVYLGRSPHEAFYTPNGKEVWVSVRGEDYVAVLDATSHRVKTRIKTPAGPGMTMFSPDGRYAYVCSSFNPETTVVEVDRHRVVGTVAQPSAFCPNIAVSPDGSSVWLTLKDIGKVLVFDAHPPFAARKTLETGPITNHVSLIATSEGPIAYVTIGGRNEVQVYRAADFRKLATIPVGALPHGLWPSPDGSRMYVGLENEDALAVIDTRSQAIVARIPVGQAPQAVVYVPGAAANGDGRTNLAPLSSIGRVANLTLSAVAGGNETSVALFDQGLVQMLQASVTGLAPKQPYLLASSARPDGGGPLELLSAFTTNPSGAAIVNAIGPIRQLVKPDAVDARRYLVIAGGTPAAPGAVVQLQSK